MATKFNHSSSAFRICVDSVQDGRLSGLVYSQMVKEPLPFSDATQLLLQIEAVLDAQNYPQAFQRTRAFCPKQADFHLAAEGPGEGLTAREVADAAGAFATLTLHVVTRRSSTWQGQIDWEDGTPPEQFPSVLALMHLLDEKVTNR